MGTGIYPQDVRIDILPLLHILERICVIAKSAILSVIFFLFDLILGNFLSLYIAE